MNIKHTIILLITGFSTTLSFSQNVGINATGAAANSSAALDVDFTTKGLLIPRVALTTINAAGPITSPATSLLVYNTATAGASPNNVIPGYYYWDGTKWIALGGHGSKNWALLGNAGTTDGTDFLGTTDNVPLSFRVNNQKAGRIETALGANVFFGYQAGNVNANGYNTGIGTSALLVNTSGNYNTAVGHSALSANTTGASNLAVGPNAMLANTTGNYNVAVGQSALQNNTTGQNNVAFGLSAIGLNTSGSFNIALGNGALGSNLIGGNNVAIGSSALLNSVASDNVSIGAGSSQGNTTGTGNSIVGHEAFGSNTTGSYNTANGQRSLRSNTTANYNTAMGYLATYLNTSGTRNASFGALSMVYGTTANDNTAIGYGAMNGDWTDPTNITGSSNTALGSLALGSISLGNNNTALGVNSLLSNKSGNNNIALGYNAGDNITTGSNNIILGYNIDAPSATGSNQLSIGNLIYGTGVDGTATTLSTGKLGIGVNNPLTRFHVVGRTENDVYAAFIDNSLATTAAGRGWGLKINAYGNLLTLEQNGASVVSVVADAGVSDVLTVNQTSNGAFAASITNTLAGFGRVLKVSSSSVQPSIPIIQADNGGGTVFGVFADGNIGMGTTAPAEKLEVCGNIKTIGNINASGTINASQAITCSSDLRFKKDISPIKNSLTNVLKLQGVSYNWRTDEFKNRGFTDKPQIGFIAQELEKTYPELVQTDKDGYKSIDYSRLTPILVEAIKEQEARIKNLEKLVEQLLKK